MASLFGDIYDDGRSRWERFKETFVPWWLSPAMWRERAENREIDRRRFVHNEDMRIAALRNDFVRGVREFTHEERQEVFDQTEEEKEFMIFSEIGSIGSPMYTFIFLKALSAIEIIPSATLLLAIKLPLRTPFLGLWIYMGTRGSLVL